MMSNTKNKRDAPSKSSAKKQNDVEKEYLLSIVFNSTNLSILDKLKPLELLECKTIYCEKTGYHRPFCDCFFCHDGQYYHITMEKHFDTRDEYLICKRKVKKIFGGQKYTLTSYTEVHREYKTFVKEMNYENKIFSVKGYYNVIGC
jgi:hypothetical protein